MSEVRRAIQVLQSKGYRVTLPRKQVLSVLARARGPVSPYDIQRILRQEGQHLNHVTIYRVLGLLCLLNLAHKPMLTGGFVKCTLGDKEGCHRFMVCGHCGGLQEFADKALCEEENEIAQDLGFHTERHFSEFFGVCSNCQG